MRTTIAYNDDLMLCHFHLNKEVAIALHAHVAAQNGFLIKGRLRIKWETGKEFLAEPGDDWRFKSSERHGAEAVEESEAIECFTPIRHDYIPRKQ